MERLSETISVQYLDDYTTFHRHQKSRNREPVTEQISVRGLPAVRFPAGVTLPKKTNGAMPESFRVPVLTDFNLLRASNCNPSDFLYDVDVFTTLAAIRSLLCQWVAGSSVKSEFLRRNPHFCEMDWRNRMFLNTATNYTVPFEMSTTALNRFAMLDHGQSWEDFIDTSYSGIAKIVLNNGCRVAFTYKMYAQHMDQPVDILVKSENQFRKETEFQFLNCFLTKKKLWRYECHHNRTYLKEQFESRDLWDRMSPETQCRIIDAFENRLPNWLWDVGNCVASEDVVNRISPVNQTIQLKPNHLYKSLY